MVEGRDSPEVDAPTKLEHGAVTPSSKVAAEAAPPRRRVLSEWLKDEVEHSFGTKLGRYALLRMLGEGGMGVVFAAYDEELDRRVAIKLLRTPAEGAGFDRALLRNEARAMARLSHPNIVQVYDVGDVEEQLFVAMEFVVGESLKDWFQRERRSWREVVDMCVQAGRGLQAAHEAGLVHCDFKPLNVLVGKDGRARVLDFGLAQLHGRTVGAGSGADAPASVHGGTPAYMAPELHLHGEPDARSDQFAFCVTLYEGLFGQRPFRGKGAEALKRAICDDQVVPPPADTRVPGWLSHVVLRGLSHEPTRRWPGMQALLAELQRDPQRARRRWAVGAGLAGALSLGSLGAWQWRAAETAAALERCQAPEAEVAGMFGPERRAAVRQAILGSGLPYAARSADVVEDAIDAFIDGWIRVHAAACTDAVIRGTIPADMMLLRERCGERQHREVAATLDVLAAADRTVVDHIDTLVARLPEPEHCQELRALAELASETQGAVVDPRREVIRVALLRVGAEFRAGRFKAAQDMLRPLLDEADTLDDRALRSEIYELAAECASQLGQLDEVDDLRLRGLTDALAADHVGRAAMIANHLAADELFRRGRLAEAGRWSRLAEGLVTRADDELATYTHVYFRAAFASMQRKYTESLALYDQALELSGRFTHVETINFAGLISNRGIVLNYLGRHAEAIAAYEASIARIRDRYGDEHPAIASTLGNIGLAHLAAGELDAAIRTIRAAAELEERLRGATHPRLAVTLQNLAAAEIEAGALDDALAHATRARAILAATVPDDHMFVGLVSLCLGDIERRLGHLDPATELCNTSLTLLEKHVGSAHVHLTYPLLCLGEIALTRGKPSDARPLLERALALLGDSPDVTNADRGHVRNALARALAGAGDPARARELAGQALDFYAKAGPFYQQHHATVASWLQRLPPARP